MAPNSPVSQDHRRRVIIDPDKTAMSPLLFASEISLTALNEIPRPVIEIIIFRGEFKRPIIPTPPAPSNTATNLTLTIPIRIVKTCTPPNNEVALKIWR
jgi:hypothetical protein